MWSIDEKIRKGNLTLLSLSCRTELLPLMILLPDLNNVWVISLHLIMTMCLVLTLPLIENLPCVALLIQLQNPLSSCT
jgi:hypothetical protein